MKTIEVKKGKGQSEGNYLIWIDGGVNKNIPSIVGLLTVLQIAIGVAREFEQEEGISVQVFDCVSEQESFCKNCDSNEVEIRAWICQKDGTISGETGDDSDTWCRSCETHSGIEYREVTEPILIYETK